MRLAAVHARLDQRDPRGPHAVADQTAKRAVAIDIATVKHYRLCECTLSVVKSPSRREFDLDRISARLNRGDCAVTHSSLRNLPSSSESSPSTRTLPRRRSRSDSSTVSGFPRLSFGETERKRAKSLRYVVHCARFAIFIPSLLRPRFPLQRRPAVLQAAGQNQIIVREISLIHHGHVFLLPSNTHTYITCQSSGEEASRSVDLSLRRLLFGGCRWATC